MKRLFAFAGAFFLLAVLAVSVSAQSGGAGFYDFETNVRMWRDAVVVGDIYARDDLTVTDQLVVQGDITLSDDLAVTDLLAAGKVRATKGATQTLTADATINNTYTFQPISAAGNIGTSAIATLTATAGDVLVLENVANVNIVITDTGTTMLTGNITLAQYDTLGLVYDGTNWVMLFTANN
jgi:hypothetical protein